MIKNNYFVIGLMSGTSLDGLDIVYTNIWIEDDLYKFQIINAETVSYPKEWETQLRNAFSASAEELNELDITYGKYTAVVVNNFLQKYKIHDVDFIASHGHTIFHKPDEGYTLQIGNGQVISNATNLRVVCDFRTQDVALGGQGAPLVPIGDKLLFSEYAYCLNLGGFANISFQQNDKRLAFDVCPVNIVLNYYAQKLGFDFDQGGKLASEGNVNTVLLEQLNAISFYNESYPKSLGFEFVESTIFPLIDKFSISEKNILRTFTEHIVQQISNCLNNKASSKVLVTGGGAFNSFLINLLSSGVSNEIIVPSNEIINYKEALIFALLGVLRIQNKTNCLQSVTGALKDHSSGKIFLKNN